MKAGGVGNGMEAQGRFNTGCWRSNGRCSVGSLRCHFTGPVYPSNETSNVNVVSDGGSNFGENIFLHMFDFYGKYFLHMLTPCVGQPSFYSTGTSLSK
jgi:hypothetical protein